MALVPLTFIGWGAMALTTLVLGGELPVAVLLSLGVLAGGYEAIHALHVGTERIGRYLQVYYETEIDGPRWETTALAVGPALPGGGIDPLFSAVFVGATIVNLLSALVPQPTQIELAVVGLCHAGFIFRVIRARGAASRQRAVELETFKALRLRQRDRDEQHHPIG